VLGVEKAILVGNSAGGTVAALAALRYPGRVEALILVDPAIYGDGGHFPGWLRPLLASPQARRLGPLFVRSIREWGEETIRLAWHDPVRITAETYEGYRKPLQAENWDRALWELTLASHSLDLGQRLAGIQMPVLVITGDDDRIVPTEQSIRLAGELPDAELVVIPNCGHVPHEECPEAFLEAVHDFAGSLPWGLVSRGDTYTVQPFAVPHDDVIAIAQRVWLNNPLSVNEGSVGTFQIVDNMLAVQPADLGVVSGNGKILDYHIVVLSRAPDAQRLLGQGRSWWMGLAVQ
jgi:predicted alpha/beta hydrolase family esterase